MLTNGNEKVFHSTDGGLHWNHLGLDYPSGIPANRLLFDDVTSCLYVSTDVGIFRWEIYRPDKGWEYLSETMPFKLVTDLERDYINNRLIAATHGRGIWEGILPEDECYDENPLTINTTVYWDDPMTVCSDVYINSGGHLIVSGEITMSKGATIFVENGGEFEISSGDLINGNITVKSGGIINLENDGKVILTNGDEFESKSGSIVNINNGSIILE